MEKLEAYINEGIAAEKSLDLSRLTEISELIKERLSRGNKILVFGNGGSATQAEHFARELVVKFKKERRPLPAIALSSAIASFTAIGNDYSFDNVFERQSMGMRKKEMLS